MLLPHFFESENEENKATVIKKLININVNFSFRLYFMCQNRLKMGFSNLSVLQKGLLIQDWLFRLGRIAVDQYLVQKENEGSEKSCLITYDAYQVLNLTSNLI